MTPADVILIFVILLAIGGIIYYRHADHQKIEGTGL